MKNIVKWFGFIALVAVIGFSIVGCDFEEDNSSEKKFVFTGNGHSYAIINKSISWTDAKRECEKRGGYLATITSSAEQAFVVNLLNQEGNKNTYWIGGYCESDRQFKWVTNEPFEYANWGYGEPNNQGGSEDKIQMLRSSYDSNNSRGTWNDENNAINDSDAWWSSRGFVCEWN